MKNRTGVISYISVIQLILLVVAGGTVLYYNMVNQVQMMTTETYDPYSDISIDSSILGEDKLTVYMRNIGSIPIEIDKVYLDNLGTSNYVVNNPGTGDDVISTNEVAKITVQNPGTYHVDQIYEFTFVTKNDVSVNFRIIRPQDGATTPPPPPPTVHDYKYVNLDTSDVDSSPDLGSLTGFTDVQSSPDTVYASLIEALIVGPSLYDFVDSSSDIDGQADTGTHSTFGNMKNVDTVMNTLTEQTTVTPETGFRVLHGSFHFSAGTTSIQNIGATVDLTRSFLVMYSAGTSAPREPDEGSVMGYLSSTTQITFERQLSSTGLYVSWFVVECLNQEFTVRGRGEITLANGVETNTDAVVGVVDPAQCTVMYGGHQGQGTARTDWEDTVCNVHLTDSTTVTAKRHSASVGTTTNIRYEVVEWSSDYNIYTGETTVNTATVTDLITGVGVGSDPTVDMGRSIMFANWWSEQNGIQQVQVFYSVTDTNEVTLGQYNGGRNPLVRWYVVEFSTTATPTIQKFSYNWDPTTAASVRNNAITSVNTSTTFIRMSCSTSGTGTAFRRDFNLPRLDSDISWSETQYNPADQNYDQHETRASIIELPHSPSASNNALNLEAQFTTVNTGHDFTQLGVLTGVLDAEDVSLSIWDTGLGDWSVLAYDLTASAWNNFTVTSFVGTEVTIRFLAGTETGDMIQDTWNIDALVLKQFSEDYRLEQEMQWTTCNSTLTNGELNINTGAQYPENLQVQIWDKTLTQWNTVIASLTPSTWNNVSIKSYMIDDLTVTIRFIDATTTGDTNQDTWQLDSVLLHSYE